MYTSQIPSPLPRAEGWRQGSRHRRARGIQPRGPSAPPRNASSLGEQRASLPLPEPPLGSVPRAPGSSRGQNHPERAQHPPRRIFSFAASPTRGETATPAPKPPAPPLRGQAALPFPPRGCRSSRSPACFPTQPAGSLQRWQGARLSRSSHSGAPLAAGVSECLRTGSVKSRLPGTARPSAPWCAAGGREGTEPPVTTAGVKEAVNDAWGLRRAGSLLTAVPLSHGPSPADTSRRAQVSAASGC